MKLRAWIKVFRTAWNGCLNALVLLSVDNKNIILIHALQILNTMLHFGDNVNWGGGIDDNLLAHKFAISTALVKYAKKIRECASIPMYCTFALAIHFLYYVILT